MPRTRRTSRSKCGTSISRDRRGYISQGVNPCGKKGEARVSKDISKINRSNSSVNLDVAEKPFLYKLEKRRGKLIYVKRF